MMKKILTIAAMALCCLHAAAQATAYKITGTVPEDVKKVYLGVLPKGETIDSAAVTGGKFELDGTLPLNEIMIVATSKGVVPLFNDGAPVSLNIVSNTLEGSELNKKLYACDRQLAEFGEEANKTFVEYEAALNDTTAAGRTKAKELRAECERLQNEYLSRQLNIIKANTDNLIPAVYLNQTFYVYGYETLKDVITESAPYYNHPAMARAKAFMAAYEKRLPGKMFTDMTMNDTEGKPRRLSEWCGKGNYVLVDFWASWCGPCRQEMPNVVANYAKYHEKGFEIVGVSFDNNAEAWKNAIKSLNLNWPNISDLKGWRSAAAAAYGISSIPANVLLDGSGKIVAVDLRGNALGAKLKEVYGF